MKIIRSSKHPGLRIAPGKAAPGIALTKVAPELSDRLAVGDRILSVDEHPIEDSLDFHYYCALSLEPELALLDPAGAERRIRIEGEQLEGDRLEFEPLVFKTCGNNCVFCFIHQMPKGLRQDLYFMDEDYRLGFLYGNYVTMALVREAELQRILSQHLSPVYLSVHSTDMGLRNRMLGLKRSRDVHEVIRRLLDGGITLHGQIVLVPGWNDGPELDRSLDDLSRYIPGMESVGIVPVGLTAHREGLPSLRGFEAAGYGAVVDQVAAFRERCHREHGLRFVHLADEFFLEAGRPLPASEDYEEFFLIDNGIGMSRDFVERVREERRTWIEPQRQVRVGLITGRLGQRLFSEYVADILADLPGLDFVVQALDNELFGSRITVSGLLPGKEILAGILALPRDLDLVLIPPNTLNADGLFLDDLSLEELRRRAPFPILVPETGLLTALGDFLRHAS